MDRFPNVIPKTVGDGYMEVSDRNRVFQESWPLASARTGGAGGVLLYWFSCQDKRRLNSDV